MKFNLKDAADTVLIPEGTGLDYLKKMELATDAKSATENIIGLRDHLFEKHGVDIILEGPSVTLSLGIMVGIQAERNRTQEVK